MKKPFLGLPQRRSPSLRRRGSPWAKDAVRCGKGKKYKYQSRVHHDEDRCSPQRRENICFYPSFKSNQT